MSTLGHTPGCVWVASTCCAGPGGPLAVTSPIPPPDPLLPLMLLECVLQSHTPQMQVRGAGSTTGSTCFHTGLCTGWIIAIPATSRTWASPRFCALVPRAVLCRGAGSSFRQQVLAGRGTAPHLLSWDSLTPYPARFPRHASLLSADVLCPRLVLPQRRKHLISGSVWQKQQRSPSFCEWASANSLAFNLKKGSCWPS